eukprot:11208422-Lingulodinium_polyedra.AAC.1
MFVARNSYCQTGKEHAMIPRFGCLHARNSERTSSSRNAASLPAYKRLNIWANGGTGPTAAPSAAHALPHVPT